MNPIGFSTGALAKADFRRGIDLVRQAGTSVIELSALRARELPVLIEAFSQLDLTPFQYVSVHAPSQFEPFTEPDVIDLLKPVCERRLPIVLHPDASSDLSLWRPFGSLVLIENMDKRKSTGRTVAELAEIFAVLPQARLCFDIAHARQLDPSMAQAGLILRRFSQKLAQVHISEVDIAGRHSRLTIGATFAYPRVLPLIPESVPVIIESVLEEHEIASELKFTSDLFANRLQLIKKLAL